MSLFGKEVESLGTEDTDKRSSYLVDSGLYECTVEYAYVNTTKNGGKEIIFQFRDKDDHVIKSRQYVLNAEGTTFKAGGKADYPGFVLSNTISLLTTGSKLLEHSAEEKVINLYNFDLKKEAPTKVQMIMELVGKDIILGVLKRKINKKNRQYKPINEYTFENVVDKAFRAEDYKTVTEILAQAEEATQIHKWKETNEGIVKDLFTPIDEVPEEETKTSSSFGGNTGNKTKSLFG